MATCDFLGIVEEKVKIQILFSLPHIQLVKGSDVRWKLCPFLCGFS